MAFTTTDIRFSVPLYTLAEAARALDVPSTTFARWGKGYEVKFRDGRTVKGEAVVTVLAGTSRIPVVPFVGLAEGMVLAAVRRAGVPLQRIRPALDALAKEMRIDHALASRALYTDGAEILFDYAHNKLNGVWQSAVRDLVVVRSGQRVFTEVIEEYLRRITYGPDGYATRLRLPSYERAEVVADPARSFGQPIFTRGGATVTDVLDRFWAGEAIDEVANEFGVPPAEIEDVLRATSRRHLRRSRAADRVAAPREAR